MRTLLVLVFLSMLPASFAHSVQPVQGGSDVHVVLLLEGLDDGMLSRLATEVGRERSAGLEYSCTWSGVVVLKFTDAPVTERADAITMTRRLLGKAGIERGVEFLHIKVEPKGPGKC